MTDHLKRAREVFGVRGELCKHISASEYAIHKILSHLEEKEKAGCVDAWGLPDPRIEFRVNNARDEGYARGVKDERERVTEILEHFSICEKNAEVWHDTPFSLPKRMKLVAGHKRAAEAFLEAINKINEKI